MESIGAKLYSHDKYTSDEPAHLIFELTNHTKKPVHILKWNTPLEGLKSDCLQVTKNGKTVPYDGKLVKRSPPKPRDFINLEPGKSIMAKTDVSEAYDLSGTGTVKVNYKPDKLVYYRQPPTTESLLSGPIQKTDKRPLKIVTKQAVFTMTRGTAKKLTQAEMIRQQETKKSSGLKKKIKNVRGLSGTPSLKPCLTKGGSSRRKKIVVDGHQNGYGLAVDVTNNITKDAKYKTWFGAYTKARFNRVKKNYKNIRADFENAQFTYDLSGKGCDPGDYAYTYPGTKTISLCNSFWLAPKTGADSQAGTMVHEHSHCSAGTDDNAYGDKDCKALGKNDPEKAVRNADTHEYFAGG